MTTIATINKHIRSATPEPRLIQEAELVPLRSRGGLLAVPCVSSRSGVSRLCSVRCRRGGRCGRGAGVAARPIGLSRWLSVALSSGLSSAVSSWKKNRERELH